MKTGRYYIGASSKNGFMIVSVCLDPNTMQCCQASLSNLHKHIHIALLVCYQPRCQPAVRRGGGGFTCLWKAALKWGQQLIGKYCRGASEVINPCQGL